MNPGARKVLGIDCGTAIVGWAVMTNKNNKLIHEACGDITTPKELDMHLRLKIIYEKLLEIIKKYLPEQLSEVAVEKIVKAVIEKADIKEFGRLMGEAMKELKGKADGKEVSEIVSELLAAS